MRATRLDRARPLLNALKKATTILPTENNLTEEKKMAKERKTIAASEENEESKNILPKDLKKREEIKERHRQKDAEMKTKMQVLQEKIKYNP